MGTIFPILKLGTLDLAWIFLRVNDVYMFGLCAQRRCGDACAERQVGKLLGTTFIDQDVKFRGVAIFPGA